MPSNEPARTTTPSFLLGTLLTLTAILTADSSLAMAPPLDLDAEFNTPDTIPAREFDFRTRVDVNRLDCFLTNLGSFGYDVTDASSGLIYPRGSQTTVLYAGGLWLGARVNGEVRAVVSEYSFEYLPGTVENGVPSDPQDPSYQTYKIRPGDTPGSNQDYAEWPIEDGAPVDAQGDPRHIGDQTLWSVFNDLDPSVHQNSAGMSDPFGVEVQQTTFAIEQTASASETVFFEWKIIHKGIEILEDMYISIWSDPDLGGAGDDFVGSDPTRSLGFCYNATNTDNQYGSRPPAVGMVFVQGPIVPSPGDQAYVSGRIVPDYRNLDLTAFNRYVSGTDPSSPNESYNYMRGLNSDGSPVVDPTTGEETTFAVSGDPVTGEGWVDTNPADRRMMLSVGPITMAPGDTQVVAVAVVLGLGTDRLTSVTEMRANASESITTFRALIEGAPGACCLSPSECLLIPAADCTGDFLFGQDCSPQPCFAPLPGACCFPNGGCFLVDFDACTGLFEGAGTTCEPNPCEVRGGLSACCFSDGSCQWVDEITCLGLDGNYVPDSACELVAPGTPPGWERDNQNVMMIKEIFGEGGVPVPPDDRGGPGDAVWHSYNSTRDWILSAGGGDGSERRFTRDGIDEGNLPFDDLILKWDEDANNYGWWAFEDNSTGQIPFGLYTEDSSTGELTRLLVILFSSGSTPGTYDISGETRDPFTGWPATDWAYAYTGDYEAFAADAADGTMDDTSRGDVEYFARLIVASEESTLPALGSIIRFTTRDGGFEFGTGFDHAVPLAWKAPEAGESCFAGEAVYEVLRDENVIGTTARTDFLDLNASNGVDGGYSIRVRNPITDEASDVSGTVVARPLTGGYAATAGPAFASPTLDGIIDPLEWGNATFLDASNGVSVQVMNHETALFLAIEDLDSVDDVRIFLDANGNGAYDTSDLDGAILFEGGEVLFSVRSGNYPDVTSPGKIVSPSWVDFGRTGSSMEIRIALDEGPLADSSNDEVHICIHSAASQGTYPPGPISVLAEAPALFATIVLTDEPASVPGISTARSFPNPLRGSTTIAYRLPTGNRVAIDVYGVDGRLVRSLQDPTAQPAGTYTVVWDGRTEAGIEAVSGVYFYLIRGEDFELRKTLTLVR